MNQNLVIDFEKFRDGDALVPEEGELLYALVRCIKPSLVIETGTHRGLSTSYIALALANNEKGRVITCDPYDWYPQQNFDQLEERVRSRIEFKKQRGDTLEIPDGESIDFAFIDGFHGKDDVIQEVEHLFPRLAPRAIVVFHDCDPCQESWDSGVNAGLKALGLIEKTTMVWSQNRVRIYEHSGT